jgi:hypothetical protein
MGRASLLQGLSFLVQRSQIVFFARSGSDKLSDSRLPALSLYDRSQSAQQQPSLYARSLEIKQLALLGSILGQKGQAVTKRGLYDKAHYILQQGVYVP